MRYGNRRKTMNKKSTQGNYKSPFDASKIPFKLDKDMTYSQLNINRKERAKGRTYLPRALAFFNWAGNKNAK